MAVGSYTRRPAALFGLSAVWLLLLSGPALAHAELIEAYPADGDALAESPEQVRLQFTEPIEAAFDPVKVYDQQGNRVDEDDARVDANDAKVLVAGLEELSEGSYTVEWRVTSVDGHVVDGTCRFAVAGAGSTHIVHGALLGLGALVVLVLALRWR